MHHITVLGSGSWGTALSRVLLDNGHSVKMWSIDEEQVKAFQTSGKNEKFLPDCILKGTIIFTTDLQEAVKDSMFIVNTIPTQGIRSVLEKRPQIREDAVIVNASKGIEADTLKRISEIFYAFYPNNRYAMISGPSHAEEVGRQMPTTLVSASDDRHISEKVQDLFMTNYTRVYAHPDVKGVELSSALKNVIAVAAGICDGMGFGDNALAALMTRGIVEIKRLGVAMEAMPETFDGLAGIGDLIVTCMSNHSRNRRCGQLLGQGYTLEDAIKKIGMAVEGVWTIKAAEALRKIYKVEMPIVEQLYRVLYQGEDPVNAVELLMQRDKRHELDDLMHDTSWNA